MQQTMAKHCTDALPISLPGPFNNTLLDMQPCRLLRAMDSSHPGTQRMPLCLLTSVTTKTKTAATVSTQPSGSCRASAGDHRQPDRTSSAGEDARTSAYTDIA